MIRTIYRAKFVLAESDLLLQNAAVHVCDPGRISRVEPWHSPPASDNVEVVDWGSAIILPGLVNAHTHLELTRLHQQLTEFSSFTNWLSQLIQKRRLWTTEDYVESVRHGAELSLASGTTLVGDISASGASAPALKTSGLRKVVFHEVLGLFPEKAAESAAGLDARLELVSPDSLLTYGVSPHAPYSVAPELYRATAETACQRRIPLATHLAETREEREFLGSGSGEFRDFMTRLGALPGNWKPPGLAPIPYLDSLGALLPSALLVHCNYLDRESMATILHSRSSVAYCPRSHAFFGHEEHPVRELLDMGVNVALGTDSLASNCSLSILDEMRFLFRSRKDLRCPEIIRMATLNGASALHFGGVLGRLRRGYWADMTILQLPEKACAKNLASQILEGAGECIGTIVQGEIAWRKT
jgi:cytosine/adenosine deaminase-related metal-dependent hydrolase